MSQKRHPVFRNGAESSRVGIIGGIGQAQVSAVTDAADGKRRSIGKGQDGTHFPAGNEPGCQAGVAVYQAARAERQLV